ncbi:MAG: glycosyltransferase family 39 protein, partial [Vicinamibacteria bacterium]
MIETRSLRPDSFINPSLPQNATLPVVWLQQRAAAAGFLHGRASDPLLAMRILAALAGAAAVVVLGRAAQAHHPRLHAWPALLLAIAPGFVNVCHFATPEAWLLLGTSTTIAATLAFVRRSAAAWAVGLALGLTASTKYTAAALALPVLLAVAWRAPRARDRRDHAFTALAAIALACGVWLEAAGAAALAPHLHLADARMLQASYSTAFLGGLAAALVAAGLAGFVLALLAARGARWAQRIARRETASVAAAAAVGFVLGSPYAVLDPIAFLSGLAFNHQTRFEYKGLAGSATSFGPYLSLLGDALTWPLLAAAVVGVLVCLGRVLLRRDDACAASVIAAAAVAPYVLVSASGHQALRFVSPVLPAAAWLAAIGLAVLPRRMAPIARGLVAARAAGAAGRARGRVPRGVRSEGAARAARHVRGQPARGQEARVHEDQAHHQHRRPRRARGHEAPRDRRHPPGQHREADRR